MPIDGPVPAWLFSSFITVTLWVIMLHVGLAVVAREFRWVAEHPARLLKGLFAVLIAVPAVALAVTRNFELGRAAEIGIVLMSISPGAPVALRRSISAGGHRSFSAALQVSVAVIALISMPLWIMALDRLYDANVSIDPWQLARQVFFAQLLPLCIGVCLRYASVRLAERLALYLAPFAAGLLLILTLITLINVWEIVIVAGLRVMLAIALVTVLTLACGHLIGGPDASTRTATAIASAARNPGLALLVISLNGASPAVAATVLAYLLISALTVVPYVMWRRRSADHDTRNNLGA